MFSLKIMPGLCYTFSTWHHTMSFLDGAVPRSPRELCFSVCVYIYKKVFRTGKVAFLQRPSFFYLSFHLKVSFDWKKMSHFLIILFGIFSLNRGEITMLKWASMSQRFFHHGPLCHTQHILWLSFLLLTSAICWGNDYSIWPTAFLCLKSSSEHFVICGNKEQLCPGGHFPLVEYSLIQCYKFILSEFYVVRVLDFF